ncbi:MAG TPA: DAK2 domain fusion protein YloV, partial [Dermatophilaceae bacterium]|nr:DAK2 domain fusion protein YloV [Dermatophilaceae bacterium]
ATRHGAVSVASKEADTPVGVCRPGDVLGFVSGAIAVIGQDVSAVGREVALTLLADGGELLTLVSGATAPEDLAGYVAEAARERHPDLEVSVIEGGQPLYPLLVGVE